MNAADNVELEASVIGQLLVPPVQPEALPVPVHPENVDPPVGVAEQDIDVPVA